jgi:hypothetical protein
MVFFKKILVNTFGIDYFFCFIHSNGVLCLRGFVQRNHHEKAPGWRGVVTQILDCNAEKSK